MSRSKTNLVLILGVLAVGLCLACDSETTGPSRNDLDPVDPVDWDGHKDSSREADPWEPVSDAPSRDSRGMDFDARNDLLGPELGPHDHTIIMQAILTNVQTIVARLPQNQQSSGLEVLRAALTVPGIGSYTKSRIRLVVNELARLERAQCEIPDETLQAMGEVLDRIDACPTVADKAEALQGMIESGRYDGYAGLSQGMATGTAILLDGEKTIYRPRVLLNLKRLVQQDVAGAIAGAITGGIVAGPPGAGVGALAGAAGASGSDLVGQLTGWW